MADELLYALAFTTTRGLQRELNEDALFVNGRVIQVEDSGVEHSWVDLQRREVFCVADGLGGHPAGELASRFVAGEAGWRMPLTTNSLAGVLEGINKDLFALSKLSERREAMGSTLAAIIHDGTQFDVVCVGDSCIFKVDQVVERLSEDFRGGSANRMTMSFGGTKKYEKLQPQIRRGLVAADAPRLVLCTDGVTDSLSPSQLESAFRGATAIEVVSAVRRKVFATRASDNFAIIVIDRPNH